MSRTRESEVRTILARTSGFIAAAGFSHSLNPARNCTFGCTHCYVPTLRLLGGLRPEDWQGWGQFTTFKTNAPALLRKHLKPDQVIYCSPVVDPYQPEEAGRGLMPEILAEIIAQPPRLLVIQTRGPLVLRDVALLRQIPRVRVSFSLTTNREDVRQRYEPHCATFEERLRVIRELVRSGVDTYATLAPVLPCDPEALVDAACAASPNDLIADPLHIRARKAHGATTREAAHRIAGHHQEEQWLSAGFQEDLVLQLRTAAARHHRELGVGAEGFSLLARQ